MASDAKFDKNIAAKDVHKHERNMHPGKPLTKLAKGGVTNMQRKAVGFNMARINNQKAGRGR